MAGCSWAECSRHLPTNAAEPTMPMTIDDHEHIGACRCSLKTHDWQAIHQAIGVVMNGMKRADPGRTT